MFNDTINLKHELLRKSIHLTSLLTIPIMYFGGRVLTLTLIGIAMIVFLCIEYGRLRRGWHWIGTVIVKNTARGKESDKLIVAPLAMALGIGGIILVFQNDAIVYSAICAAALGDSFAAIGGKILKNPKKVGPSHKSYIGAFSCFLISTLSAYLFTHSLILSFIGGVVATIVELLPLGSWDNTLIPFTVAGAMSLALFIL